MELKFYILWVISISNLNHKYSLLSIQLQKEIKIMMDIHTKRDQISSFLRKSMYKLSFRKKKKLGKLAIYIQRRTEVVQKDRVVFGFFILAMLPRHWLHYFENVHKILKIGTKACRNLCCILSFLKNAGRKFVKISAR